MLASRVCSSLGSGASLCGSDQSFLFHYVTWERADSWARRGMRLRGVTVSGSRVRALMGADFTLGHWLFLSGPLASSAGHWT